MVSESHFGKAIRVVPNSLSAGARSHLPGGERTEDQSVFNGIAQTGNIVTYRTDLFEKSLGEFPVWTGISFLKDETLRKL